jgi:hypothetical protein
VQHEVTVKRDVIVEFGSQRTQPGIAVNPSIRFEDDAKCGDMSQPPPLPAVLSQGYGRA